MRERESAEKVELARRFIEHWNATGEPLWEIVDTDATFTLDEDFFLAGTYHGHDGLRTIAEQWWEAFTEFRFEAERIVDAGDAVVVLGRIHFRGTGSGATGAQEFSTVSEFRDGKVVRWRTYRRRADALEAAGISD